jgi:hypothetical protein
MLPDPTTTHRDPRARRWFVVAVLVFVVESLVPLAGALVSALALDSDPYDTSYLRIGCFIIAAAPPLDILRMHALAQLEHSAWRPSYQPFRWIRASVDGVLTVTLIVLGFVQPFAIIPLAVALIAIALVSQYVTPHGRR